MEDYKEIRELLKPRRDIKASDELRRKVRTTLDKKRKNRMLKNWVFGGISLSAVAAVLLLVLIPSGMSAKEILSQAIEAMRNYDSIEMVVDVRTRPVENFRYIGLDDEFVTHHIDIVASDSLLNWRIDKGERVALSNGKDIYTWIPSVKLGFHITDTENENVLGYMANLLTPRMILEAELHNCISNSDAEYTVSKSESDIVLTVHTVPQGNFENPYLLNSSILESENVRRYVIDVNTKELKSATVSVLSGGREIVVLKVMSISYNNNSNAFPLPEDIKFVETENQPVGLKGLSAVEAASAILNAFSEWNVAILDKVMIHEVSDAAYREQFSGSRLISVGNPFTSGAGNSTFVPYTLKLRDGTMQRHNIALQKTDSGGWIVVGGL
ncbi:MULTISPECIES: hypothetical protein [Bacteroidales]|uniref:hypothetical protein n=1 Tax=Bacteroidales TaxID=171549 RepID=UPI00258D7531|nr:MULTISPECIES: hypothetical protein [Bacteroidales]